MLMHHSSGRICRSTKSFLTVLSRIVDDSKITLTTDTGFDHHNDGRSNDDDEQFLSTSEGNCCIELLKVPKNP